MDRTTKRSLAENIILVGYTLALIILLGIQIGSATVLYREGHSILCFALATVGTVNLIVFVYLFFEVFADKMDDL